MSKPQRPPRIWSLEVASLVGAKPGLFTGHDVIRINGNVYERGKTKMTISFDQLEGPVEEVLRGMSKVVEKAPPEARFEINYYGYGNSDWDYNVAWEGIETDEHFLHRVRATEEKIENDRAQAQRKKREDEEKAQLRRLMKKYGISGHVG